MFPIKFIYLFFLDTEALAFILAFICFFREYALYSIQTVVFDDY